MLTESLEGDRLIAMATLTGGLPFLKGEEPPIASTICLGKIVSHAELEDDRHNILLVGIRRAKVVRELDAGRPFRIAKVEVSEDVYPPTGSDGRLELKKRLLQSFAEVIPVSKNVQQNLHELMSGQMGLGPITDIISYTLPFTVEQKLNLLSEADVDSRANELLRLLNSGAIQFGEAEVGDSSGDQDGGPPFPPPFSLN
jgi:ATP-dependent Lon protease